MAIGLINLWNRFAGPSARLLAPWISSWAWIRLAELAVSRIGKRRKNVVPAEKELSTPAAPVMHRESQITAIYPETNRDEAFAGQLAYASGLENSLIALRS